MPNRKSLLFVPLTKVDHEQRLVYGRAADETPDDVREVFDYDSSKPHFEKWSGDIAKATDNKSLGNVRAMHGAVAAGKLDSITFDDVAKSIDIVAKIVDDNEWEKVCEGVYTGFSIGGRYGRVWSDRDEPANKRYTAIPKEISIVDLPANPSATFAMVKAAGVVEETFFKIAERKDRPASQGEHEYGDVEYADPKNKAYPINTPERIRAAWNYIHVAANREKYSAEDAATITARIAAAWRSKIDPKGPPSADAKKSAGSPIQSEDVMDATVEQLTAALEKKMSAAHKDRVQAIHDHAAAMGADCDSDDDAVKAAKVELTKRGDELTKMTAERDELAKANKGLTDERDTLAKRVKELEEKPGDSKAALLDVTKTADMNGGKSDDVKKLEAPSPDDPQYAVKKQAYDLELIKTQVHSQPQTVRSRAEMGRS